MASRDRSQITVTIVNAAPQDDEFCAFSESHPDASIYHHPAWLRCVEGSYRLSAFHHLARRDGRIAGFLPLYAMRTLKGERAGVSSPFSNYGGPLAEDDAVTEALLQAAAETAARERWSYLEFKHRHAGDAVRDWRHVDHFCSPVVELGSLAVEEVWEKKVRGKARNQVRKAQQSGLELREGLEREYHDFLSIYTESMRDLGTPGHGKAWFSNLKKHLASRLVNLVVYHEGRPIGGAIVLREREGAILQYCLCLRSFRRMCPNNMLYWGAIERGVQDGWQYFDFGRSRMGEGTHKFKLQWGAEDLTTPYSYHIPANSRRTELPDMHPANPAFHMFIRVWQSLPVPLARVIGPRIRPHLTT